MRTSAGADRLPARCEAIPGDGEVADRPARTRSGRTRSNRTRSNRTRSNRTRWWVDILVVAWLAWVYDLLGSLPAGRARAATAHGLAVAHLEQRLHLDPEHTFNNWLAGHHTLGLLAGDYYDNAHFVVTFGVIGWLWWRHPHEYRPLRSALVVVNVIGFVVFWAWPMAPPRLLPGEHWVDVVAVTHAVGGAGVGAAAHVANNFAAMPSLHLAWATWSALAARVVFADRRWRSLAWLYPVVTVVDVLATANHFLADCAAGVLTAGLAWWIALACHRRWDRTYRAGPAAPL